MNKDKHTNISLSEGAWLTSKLGLRLSPLSPLRRTAESAGSDGDRRSLMEKGLIDTAGQPFPDTVTCMNNLAGPGAELVIDVGNALLIDVMKVYFGPSGTASACTQLDISEFRISPTIGLEDILLTLLEGLQIEPTLGENPFACDLTQKGLLALSALIDATRQSQLRCLLNRNDNIELVVDFLDVWACLQRGLIEDSFRWLTAVIRSRLPDEMTVDQQTLSEGLEELRVAGLAWRDDTEWALAEDRVEFLSELMTPLHFGSVFARASTDEKAVHLFLIRCPSSLWGINFSSERKQLSLFTLSADRMATIVTEIIANLIAIGKTRSATSALPPAHVQAPSRFCSGCGAAVVDGARFCAGCGKPVAPPESKPSCPSCGKPTKAEQKFCAGCGHRLA